MKVIRFHDSNDAIWDCRLLRTEISGKDPVRVFAVHSPHLPISDAPSCRLEVDGDVFPVVAVYGSRQSSYYRILASVA